MALNEDAKDLVKLSEKLFGKRSPLLSLWQEISDNFYPELSPFTYRRDIGSEFADHLIDSFPLLVRRELGNSITSMLRPTGQDWGEMTIQNEDVLDSEGRAWLQWAWARQRQAMYQVGSQFVRATKEGDHDFATFGQTVIKVGLNRARTGLIYRKSHLKDCVWRENEEQRVDMVFCRRRYAAADLLREYGEDKVGSRIASIARGKDPYAEVDCLHAVVPAERYGEAVGALTGKNSLPFASVYLCEEHGVVFEGIPSRTLQYVIPRWQTMSESQYAFSPATIVALPDARLIQAISLTLLEAGEKFVNPPLIATQEAVRSGIEVYAGGVTWVDAEYNEKLGAALRPLQQDRAGMPVGFEQLDRQKEQIRQAFYLNQISGVPKMSKEMTAFEVGQLVQEYIRQAAPLFEPLETEYNGGICEETFQILFWGGAFGSPSDVPDSLAGREVEFKFRSPLHDTEKQETSRKFFEAAQLLGPAMEMDPTVVAHLDVHRAFRDALDGAGVPEDWLVDEEQAQQELLRQQQVQEAQAMVAAAGGIADVAETAGRAGQELNRAAASS